MDVEGKEPGGARRTSKQTSSNQVLARAKQDPNEEDKSVEFDALLDRVDCKKLHLFS